MNTEINNTENSLNQPSWANYNRKLDGSLNFLGASLDETTLDKEIKQLQIEQAPPMEPSKEATQADNAANMAMGAMFAKMSPCVRRSLFAGFVLFLIVGVLGVAALVRFLATPQPIYLQNQRTIEGINEKSYIYTDKETQRKFNIDIWTESTTDSRRMLQQATTTWTSTEAEKKICLYSYPNSYSVLVMCTEQASRLIINPSGMIQAMVAHKKRSLQQIDDNVAYLDALPSTRASSAQLQNLLAALNAKFKGSLILQTDGNSNYGASLSSYRAMVLSEGRLVEVNQTSSRLLVTPSTTTTTTTTATYTDPVLQAASDYYQDAVNEYADGYQYMNPLPFQSTTLSMNIAKTAASLLGINVNRFKTVAKKARLLDSGAPTDADCQVAIGSLKMLHSCFPYSSNGLDFVMCKDKLFQGCVHHHAARGEGHKTPYTVDFLVYKQQKQTGTA